MVESTGFAGVLGASVRSVSAAARSVLVVGAGVQGLSAGIVLAEAGWPVRIRTSERPRETTSAVAGAMWGPVMLRPAERVHHWAARSHEAFTALARDGDCGVHFTTGTMAARIDFGDVRPPEAELIPDLRSVRPEDLPEGFVWGHRGTVPLIDMPRYLDHLADRFTAAGGELVLSTVPSLAAAAAEAPIVVNCSGVGARELVGDPSVRPVRGQHVVVDNPGIDEFFIEISTAGQWAGFLPHGDRLVLGGVAVEHDWSREPDPRVTEGIVRRCSEIEPRLAHARIREVVCGLRPGRDSVRLSVEEYEGARIVHNYGHAGSGVALSWGCAHEAADLATAT